MGGREVMDKAASKGGGRLQESKPGIFMDGPTRGPGNPWGPLGPTAPMPASPWKAENSRGVTGSRETPPHNS